MFPGDNRSTPEIPGQLRTTQKDPPAPPTEDIPGSPSSSPADLENPNDFLFVPDSEHHTLREHLEDWLKFLAADGLEYDPHTTGPGLS